MADRKSDGKIKSIKSSVFSRSVSLAKLGIGAGAQMAGRGIAQMWENKEFRDEKWKELFARQAKNFSQEIGELKGSLMKAGQMLSMYGEHFFPPEVNQFLKSLQHDSPPVRWSGIEAILKKELPAERLAELEIEHESTASASLGQVHKAKIKSSGEVLAVKIQYPGVEKAIDSDLKAIRSFLGMMKVIPSDFDTTPIFAEIREMLHQEVNYLTEAEWTERYRQLLNGDARYVIPRIYPIYSNQHIITSSFENGIRADDSLVQNLSQDRRNRLAENFLDLYFRELFDWRVVQTDPHTGNYRVRLKPDGKDQWVLFDFGATREYSPEFIHSYRGMIRASILRDPAAFAQAAQELKFLQENDDPRLQELFRELCFMMVEPFRDEEYDWKNTDLPQRTTKKVLEILRGFKWRTPPKELIFLDRKTGGVFIMMGILRAKVHGRKLISKYIE